MTDSIIEDLNSPFMAPPKLIEEYTNPDVTVSITNPVPVTTPVMETAPTTPTPAVVNVELESALTDLALAARVMNNLSTSIEAILEFINGGGTVAQPASTSVDDPVVPTTPDPLSVRDKSVLAFFKANTGIFVTKRQILIGSGAGSYDLSASVSRIRKHGFIIESAQSARKNGEKIAKNVTGYRFSTVKQAAKRRNVNRARNEIKNFIVSLLTDISDNFKS